MSLKKFVGSPPAKKAGVRARKRITSAGLKILQKFGGNKIGFQNPVPPPGSFGGVTIVGLTVKLGIVALILNAIAEPTSDATPEDWIARVGKKDLLEESQIAFEGGQGYVNYYAWGTYINTGENFANVPPNERGTWGTSKAIGYKIPGIIIDAYFAEDSSQLFTVSQLKDGKLYEQTSLVYSTRDPEQPGTSSKLIYYNDQGINTSRNSFGKDFEIEGFVRVDGEVDMGGDPPPTKPAVYTAGSYPKVRISDITQLPDFSLPSGGIGFKPISKGKNRGTPNNTPTPPPTLPQPKGKGKNSVNPNPGSTPKALSDNKTELDKPPLPEINRELKDNEKWIYRDGKWLIKKTTKSKYDWNQGLKPGIKVITNSPDLNLNSPPTTTTQITNKTGNNTNIELEKFQGIPITIAPPPNRIPEDVEDKNPQLDYIPPPVVPPPPVQTKVDKCKGSCASKAAKNGVNLLDGNGNTISAANLFNDVVFQNDLLKRIDETTTFTKGFVSKAWRATGADKILNTVSAIASLHNAAMLSQNAAQSLGDAATNALSLFGIKDFEGQPINVNAAIGGAIKNKLTSIFGAANLDAASNAWLKLNRIHQAVSMTVYSIQGTKNALLEADEITGGHIAKVGNALQEQGIIEDDTYDWMNPEPDYQQPFSGILGKINALEEMSDRVSSVVSTGLEIKENTTEIVTNSQALIDATTDFVSTKNADETAKQTESTSPNIDRLDIIKSEPEEI